MCEYEVNVTGLARILLVFGLLVLVVGLLILWRDDRSANLEQSGVSSGAPRPGSSTLSHGGPTMNGHLDPQGRSLKPVENIPSDHPQATKR